MLTLAIEKVHKNQNRLEMNIRGRQGGRIDLPLSLMSSWSCSRSVCVSLKRARSSCVCVSNGLCGGKEGSDVVSHCMEPSSASRSVDNTA